MTYKNDVAKITDVAGVTVTIQPVFRITKDRYFKLGRTKTVMDWEVEKKTHWLRRAWTWLTTFDCPRR